MHAVAWFLPAAEVFGVQLPGWQAFCITLESFWPGQDASNSTWSGLALAGISLIATLLFVLGSPWVVFRGSRSLQRTAAWLAAAAFILNAHWWIVNDLRRRELRIGYYCWWLSFAVLAFGLFIVSGRNNAEPIHSRADLLPERTS